MSDEIRNPRKTLPRAVLTAGVLIAVIYIIGTFAVLTLIPAEQVEPTSGVFQASPRVPTRCVSASWECWRLCLSR